MFVCINTDTNDSCYYSGGDGDDHDGNVVTQFICDDLSDGTN